MINNKIALIIGAVIVVAVVGVFTFISETRREPQSEVLAGNYIGYRTYTPHYPLEVK